MSQALDILTYTNKKAAVLVRKFWNLPLLTLNTTMALTLTSESYENFRRRRPEHEAHYAGAKGRADRILKRTSHITVVVPIAETLETSNGSESTS